MRRGLLAVAIAALLAVVAIVTLQSQREPAIRATPVTEGDSTASTSEKPSAAAVGHASREGPGAFAESGFERSTVEHEAEPESEAISRPDSPAFGSTSGAPADAPPAATSASRPGEVYRPEAGSGRAAAPPSSSVAPTRGVDAGFAVGTPGGAGAATKPVPPPADTPKPRRRVEPSAPPSTSREEARGSTPPAIDAPSPSAPPAASPAPAPALVRMTVDPSPPVVGGTVAVRVEIAGGVDVGSVPFHVVYNPGVLEFDHGEEGGFLRGDGRQTAFFAAPTSSRDRVVVGLSRLGGEPGIAGDGLLCVLYFRAIAPGTTGLAFASQKVRDGTNKIVPSTFVAQSVTAP